MRRLLLTAALVAAAAGTTTASAAPDPTCTDTRVGVCYQVIECARICRYHVVVDPYCNQTYPVPTLPCDPVNRLGTIDSDTILPAR
jgi:hypothetical protein